MAHLLPPQRNAYFKQISQCERIIADINDGRIPILGGTAEYFAYFIELINAGKACESVRVFLSKMDDNSLRYNDAAAPQLFAPFQRAVQRRKMRIEYTCLFNSKDHFKTVNGSLLLNRHCRFAYSVRKVFLNEMSAQPTRTDRTIVLLENRKWAITHTWNRQGILDNPLLLVRNSDFDVLYREYMSIRSHSYSYRCRK
jgi:hypothetical protein